MSAPARLLSVRLQGFKSFADRTLVTFGPGISAVVGPNGSGKSNLADALRWALGEQGRALRSRKSEDVIWAGSDRRPALGMADVQLTLDNEDGLLPVEFGTVELGRRLYRSGENDYLLNRQRVRLKALVDLLDAGHLAENAFLFIGQGMVDQALALRPEERRPLFEEVAGVRRHERRRRRAEEQLAESEANLARVDDILAELRPQARRLAQQAEQQANRRTAGDELAAAILLSAHGRWHAAASRAAEAGAAGGTIRATVDAAMAALLEQERAITSAGAALAGQATAEAEARTVLDRVRAERAALQLREGRHASDLEAAGRERVSLEESRAATADELAAAREAIAAPTPASTFDLEAELARVEVELVDLTSAGSTAARGGSGSMDAAAAREAGAPSDADAAAIRRLEAARAQELAAARRRAADAERAAGDELRRSTDAVAGAQAAAEARTAAHAELEARAAEERRASSDREAAQRALAEAEVAGRAASDRAARTRGSATAVNARLEDAKRALEAAEGGAFSRAARGRGGRPIGDGLVIDHALQPAVDAALSGLGRAQLLARAEVAPLAGERGVAIVVETLHGAVAAATAEAPRIVDDARARGGGALADAVRRDDAGAVRRLVARAVWLPTAEDCLDLQDALPPGWLAVARDGTVVVGEHAIWTRPDGRGLHLRSDVDQLAGEGAAADAAAASEAEAEAAAATAMTAARTGLQQARDREAAAVAARRRAEEMERAAAARAETATRDSAWLTAQVAHLQAEATRLRAAVPDDPADADSQPNRGPSDAADASTSAASDPAAGAVERRRREVALRTRRDELASQVAAAVSARAAAERLSSQAAAAVALAERQLGQLARAAGDLAEREARLAIGQEDLVAQLLEAERHVAEADAALATIVAAASADRDRLRTAELAASSDRERLRIAQERARLAEREDLEARLALEALREQLLVELAGLGVAAVQHLRAVAGTASADVESADAASADEATTGVDLDPDDLEQALREAVAAWERTQPTGEPPTPGRLATLRRRFHDLGAVNPFAADEFAVVRARLDGLESQRSDLQSAIDHTRQLIAELDRLIGDQFRQTFTALEQAFDARFRQLFGGGFAKLSLTDPHDLAATGVDIVARPPGKKAQALAMLSGGERALTAVALLFAMLEVRPVPFCVLDEVDAALDEANIGRFTEALRDLAKATQCIVITHNRGTIETADALYGVTVGDDSVSRVISLRLDEATALARRSPAEAPSGLEAGTSLALGTSAGA